MTHVLHKSAAQAVVRHASSIRPLLSCEHFKQPLFPVHLRKIHFHPEVLAAAWQSRVLQEFHTAAQLRQQQQQPSQTYSERLSAQSSALQDEFGGFTHAEDDDWCQRSRLLVGADGLQQLAAVNVLLVGLGGVGSFVAEFLCRAGVGSMTLVDGDTVDTTNRNRQLPALRSTVGQLKTQVVAERLKDINPKLQLTVRQEFLDPVRASALVQEQQYHYVIDCIDSVAPKQALLLAGYTAGVPTISSMGAGGRMDPSRVRLADISQTYNDSFASVVRKRLRKAGVVSGITVVFSDEPAKPASLALTQQQYKRSYFGTSSYIPALFGLYIASHVIRLVVEPGYGLPKLPRCKPASTKRTRKADSLGRQTSQQQQRSSSSSNSSARGSAVSPLVFSNGAGPLGGILPPTASGVAATAVGVGAELHKLSVKAESYVPERDASSEKQPSDIDGHSSRVVEFKAAAKKEQQGWFQSFSGVQGVGIGLDGEGI